MTDTYRDLIPVIVEREQAVLPDGYDSWGIKSVRPDLRTRGGYQWPYPGGIAEAPADRIVHTNTGTMPYREGDGLCVALSWDGMASGGIPARTLLLVAYPSSEMLGRSEDKLRCRRVAVVAVVDGERLLREVGCGANLSGVDLHGADLHGADLHGANLSGVDLRGANLSGVDLRWADLRHANLGGANLGGANLRGANLGGANLRWANLRHASLRNAGVALPAGWELDADGITTWRTLH